jgi:hypothetical protein
MPDPAGLHNNIKAQAKAEAEIRSEEDSVYNH